MAAGRPYRPGVLLRDLHGTVRSGTYCDLVLVPPVFFLSQEWLNLAPKVVT